jgi:hypothetical protein
MIIIDTSFTTTLWYVLDCADELVAGAWTGQPRERLRDRLRERLRLLCVTGP